MLSAAAASGAGYLAARSSLIDATQEHRADSVRNQVRQQAPEMRYPPKQEDLERLRTALGPDAMVTFEDRTAAAGKALALVTDELRGAVAAGDGLSVQRVVGDSGPKLLIATPVVLTDAEGQQSDSGVDVYVVEDLQPIEDQLNDWARIVALTILAALPLAVLLALLLSRSVLRPVRRLGDTAKQLATGDLSTRLEPSGRDELADLARTFNDTAAALERTVEELRHQEAEARRFVGDVSHELRTPIMALTSIMEMLEADARDRTAEERELTELAVDRTRKLVRLAEDLLELSRLDAGAVDLRVEHVDVAAALVDSLGTRGWSDDVDVAAHGPVSARVDVRRLDVAVANLAGNALRHGEPPVQIEVYVEDSDVVVVVTDHGAGLADEDDYARLFTRFYKADSSRSQSAGSGLGLSIALANAHLHGGDLTASNAEGAGARFVLRLPSRLDVESDGSDDVSA